MRSVHGVILDVDGMLVNSNDAHAIYNDPADLLTHYEQSPLAQK